METLVEARRAVEREYGVVFSYRVGFFFISYFFFFSISPNTRSLIFIAVIPRRLYNSGTAPLPFEGRSPASAARIRLLHCLLRARTAAHNSNTGDGLY